MTVVSVRPLPLPSNHENLRPPDLARRDATVANTRYYDIALVAPLPTVNLSKTLAASLLGRGDDAAFNARVIAAVQRLEAPIQHLSGVTGWASMALFFVADLAWRRALSVVVGVCGSIGLVFATASLSTDMLALLLTKFEFWFTASTIAVNVAMWNLLFHDVRVVMTTVTGINYMTSLVFDASIYTRRFSARGMLFGSPALLVSLVLAALHVPPDLHYVTFHVLGQRVEALDLLVTGNLLITYFTAARVLRCRHVVFSKTPLRTIQCDMYFPACRLVPARGSVKRLGLVLALASENEAPVVPGRQQLQLVDNGQCPHGGGGDIDARCVLAPRLARFARRCLARRVNVNVVGLAALTLSVGCSTWTAASAMPPQGGLRTALNALSVALSLLFVAAYAAHAQRALARLVFLELDTWFVLVQLTMVGVGVCDTVRWDEQPVVVVATAWIWCLWLLLLDAVPPGTRRALGYDRRLALLAHVLLVASAVSPIYWLYFSPDTRASLHNRVLFAHDFGGGVAVRIESVGFLASKLFMMGVWTCRLLWRELTRPEDVFKIIKRRVFYRVPPVSTTTPVVVESHTRTID